MQIDQRISDSMPPPDFSDRIREPAQVFVGRDWVLPKPGYWLADLKNSRREA